MSESTNLAGRGTPQELEAGAVPTISKSRQGLNCYVWITPVQAAGASNRILDLFNAAGSAATVRIKSILAIPRGDTAASTTVRVRFDLSKTSAVGTGGTAWDSSTPALDVAGGALMPLDSSNATINASVTGRHIPTGGETFAGWLTTRYMSTEETYDGTMDMELLPGMGGGIFRPWTQELVLREGEGIRVDQGSVAGAGSYQFEVVFSVE